MSFGSLALLFVFNTNILLCFLAGLGELVTFKSSKDFIMQGIWNLWVKKGLFLFLWGFLAGVLRIITPFQELFLPLFIFLFLILRVILVKLAGNKYRETMGRRVDKLISDPVLFIPVLIAGYTDIAILPLCLALLCMWLGIGLVVLLLLSIRSQLELERRRRIFVLLLSISFMAMIFTALQQLFPFLPEL